MPGFELGSGKMRKLVTAMALGLMMVSSAVAGPFGIDKGDNLEKFPGATSDGSQMYELPSVPKAHPLFTKYSVELVEGIGVCRINARSELFNDDKFGVNAKSDYEKVKAQLVSVYGKGDGGDGEFLRDGALWRDPQDFVMSLKQNERVHQTWWSAKNGGKLKDGIQTIALAIRGLSGSTSILVIQYEFDNADKCKEASAKTSTDAL